MRKLTSTVNGATEGLTRSEHLSNGAGELTSKGFVSHDSGDVDDFVEGDVSGVSDVLLLLSITRRLCSVRTSSVGRTGCEE